MKGSAILAVGFAVFVGCLASAASDAQTLSARPAAGAAVGGGAGTTQVIAYYFHGTIRCETCLKIEKQAQEVVAGRLGAEVASGQLTFKALNYDKPENAHFLKDYKLPCPSLVLVRQKGGRDQDWKLLGQTWEMIQIPPKLDLYIEKEVRKFLEGNTSKSPVSQGSADSSATTNSPPAKGRIGTSIAGLSELNALASEMNAVLLFLPPKGGETTSSALAAINGAKKTLETRFNIKIGLFTLAPGARDYNELVPQNSAPAVVAIVKTGVRRCISGELTEDKIVDGFMTAMAVGGCCPLGYPGEKR